MDLNELVGNVPGGIYLLISPILVLCLITFILIRLKSFQTHYLILGGLVACLIWGYKFYELRQDYPPTPDPKRILVFPFNNFEQDKNWLPFAFWEKIIRDLNRKTDRNWIVYNSDSIFESFDSRFFASQDYRKKFAELVDADIVVYGILVPDSSEYLGEISFKIVEGTEKDFEPFLLNKNNFTKLTDEFAEKIISEAKIENENPKFEDEIEKFYSLPLPLESYYQAKILFKENKIDYAKTLTNELLQTFPNFPPALILLGEINLQITYRDVRKDLRGMDVYYKEGRTILRKLFEKVPNSLDYWFFKTQFHTTYKEWTTVEEYLKLLFEKTLSDARFYRILYNLAPFRWENFEKIRVHNYPEILEKLVFLDPASISYRILFTDFYLEKNLLDDYQTNIKKSQKIIEEASQLRSNNVPILMRLGKVYLHKNELEKALENYHNVVSLDSTISDAYYNLGIATFQKRRFKESEKFLLKAIQMTKHLDSYFYLAALYNETEDKENALKAINKRILLSPGPSDLYIENARLYKDLILSKSTKPTELPY
ncbi:MAG: tetratricopeptide repeat protein [Calditrichaeota bacterium]|nr:MAG: tetratricopeptide repeat protein [Calditrichota bacterium]